MRIAVRLKTLDEIARFSQLGVDVFCLDTDLAVRKISVFDQASIHGAIERIHAVGKQAYVYLNKMIHQSDLALLDQWLDTLSKTAVDGLVVADLTVFVKARDYGLDHCIIYQPGTMNTDTGSIDYFNDKPIKGLTISREITLDEIVRMANQPHQVELSLVGHGYLDMFYSRRKLLTQYFVHKHMEVPDLIDDHDFRLVEKLRPEDRFPIVEDAFGTHIFRSKKLLSYDELTVLKPLLDDFFIERLFLSDDEHLDAIRLYTGHIDKDTFCLSYGNYDSGFYDQPTELYKGDADES